MPEVLQKYRVVTVPQPPTCSVNWLGVVTENSYFRHPRNPAACYYASPECTHGPALQLDEEFFEWVDVLEAVAGAKNQFVMVELGAGWGRWLSNAALALRQLHPTLPYLLVGVEPEPTHFRWMGEHLARNGVDVKVNCLLLEAAVTEEDGTVNFKGGDPDTWYGQFVAKDGNTKVRSIALGTLLAGLHTVDLVDLDVQGYELAVIHTSRTELCKKVRRVHIGTHSHGVEDGLRGVFRELGWRCLYDYGMGGVRPTPWGEISFEDGVQSYVNPALEVV